MMRPAVGQPVEDLAQRYADFPKVVEYLGAVERDVLEHGDDFRRQPEGGPVMLALAAQGAPDRELRRYAVNVLVDRTGATGAEVVFADHPTYANLVGRIEHVQHLGTLVTDFALVKPGALHRANGGYLVVDARAAADAAVRVGCPEAGAHPPRDPRRAAERAAGASRRRCRSSPSRSRSR